MLSLICAIHCAATPLLISVLPLIGMQFLASHLMEGLLLAFGVGFGVYGVMRAYWSQHHDLRPVIVLGIGTSLIAFGFFFASEAVEPFMVSIGAICMAAAQVINIRLTRRCEH